MTERERETERRPEAEEPLDGEQLVDGTGGGTHNVSDVESAVPGTGRTIGAVAVTIVAILFLGFPIAWAVGVFLLLGPLSSLLAWVYAALLFVIGTATGWLAFYLWQHATR